MKKSVVALAVLFIALSTCGCGASVPGTDVSSVQSTPSASPDENSAGDLRITEEMAIEIASRHWGIKSGDVDESTGFPFLIMPLESSNGNIQIALKWLVNNSHYSTVDTIEIDPLTGEIISRN